MKIERLLLSHHDTVLLQGEFLCHRCARDIHFTMVTQDVNIDVHLLMVHLHTLHLDHCEIGKQIPITYTE